MAKQDKDPDGSGPSQPLLPPQARPQNLGGNPNSLNPTKAAPVIATARSVSISAMSSEQIHSVDTVKQSSTSTQQHPKKHVQRPVSNQPKAATPSEQPLLSMPPLDLTDDDEFMEVQDITYEKICTMIKNSDLESFLEFKEKMLADEEEAGGSNYLILTQRLHRIELAIRSAKMIKSDQEDNSSSRPSASRPNLSGTENAATREVQNGTKIPRSTGTSFFEQECVRHVLSGYEDQMTETTHLMVKTVTEIVDNGDLGSFLQYKEEALAEEAARGHHSNYLFLKEGLERLELNILAGNKSSELDWGIEPRSGATAISGVVGPGLNVPETQNMAALEAKPSKKKRQRKKKTGHEAVHAEGEAVPDELPTMKTEVDNSIEQNNSEEPTTRIEPALDELHVYEDSTDLFDMDSAATLEALKTHDPKDAEAPKKKGKKRRGKKKAKGNIEENCLATAADTSLPNLPTADKTEPEHTCCGHKLHGRCSHTTWKNDDSSFSKALAETIRELLLSTPLDTALRFDLHVDMNKVKRRMDEVEAADGDSSILRSKKHVSAATKAPFSAFGKVDTPELQRAAAIHLLSSPKYYNGFLDYIEHLNYLVSCGDEKAPAMADEADHVYRVVTAVYKEVSDIARSKVDAAGITMAEVGLTENEIHEKRLAESAKKMRELQNLEQGIHPNDPAPAKTEQSTSELETTALSLIKQPAALRRFLADYRAMGTNGDSYGSFWGGESHLLYQKLVEMCAVVDPSKKPSSQAPLSPEKTIDALNSSISPDEAFKISSDYLTSNTVDDDSRQAVASYYASNESKLSAFLLAKSNIEERFKASGDAKLKSLKEEADRLWKCIQVEQRHMKMQDPAEADSEAKIIVTNPFKTSNFVNKVMREMVEEFAASPPGIRRFIWPLKFIAEHPSIPEKTRATAICVLTDMSLLARYEPVLEKVKEATWNQPKASTLSKLSPQQHIELFMDAVGFMKSALESVPHCTLRYNANTNQFLIPLTKRAGLPIQARVLHTIRDYEFAYNTALDDDGRAAVNKNFCLPYKDCPNYFREMANDLYNDGLEFAAFMEQKAHLANLPGCFGDAEVRQALVSSALMVESALAELDASSNQDRVRIMEVVASSSAYPLPGSSMGSIAKCEEAYAGFFTATQKVKMNFVREDIHHQVAGGKSNAAAPLKFGFDSKEHVPYFLGMWRTDEAAGSKAPIPERPTVSEDPSDPDPTYRLTPSQRKIKKQLLAANYRKAQKVPLSDNQVRDRAKKIVSNPSMLSSFFKSKESMEYGSDEDNVDEKFFLDEINRIYAEMKEIKIDLDDVPQEPVSMPRPSSSKEKRAVAPTTTLFPSEVTKSPVHPQRVTADFETHQNVKVEATPTPIIPRGRVVSYSPLGLPAHFDTSLRPNAPPLPSDPELAKECVIYETAKGQRKTLAAFYAKSSDSYEAFQEVKKEADDAAQGMDLTTEEATDTRKLLGILSNVNTMVKMLRVGSERDAGDDGEDFHKAAADLLSDFDNRERLMTFLESLEHLYDEKARIKNDPFTAPFGGPKYFKRYEELVGAAYHGLFTPEAADVRGQEPTRPFPKIPTPKHNVTKPRPLISTYSKKLPKFTNAADVIEFATDFFPDLPDLPDLASGTIPRPSGQDATAKLSGTKFQKILGELDTMPVPPKIVANLYKSGAPNAPRFADAEEAVDYLQSQVKGATTPISVSVSPNFSSLDTSEVVNEYTVVPDSTPEGQALGKAMEDIQLSAGKGNVPTDYQMAALGKARRELYDSRRGKPTAAADRASKSLSVSTRAENRAVANLLARSEAVPLVGMMTFPDGPSNGLSWSPNEVIFSNSFPTPRPAPVKIPPAPPIDEPDALQMKLRATLIGLPFAPVPDAIAAQLKIEQLFSEVLDSREYQTCRASLGLPDPSNEEGHALIGLNKTFGTYKGIRSQETQRIEDILDRAKEYMGSIVEATYEASKRNEGVEEALDRLDDYKTYNKRVMAAWAAEHDWDQKRGRQKSRRVKGMGKKLGAYRKSTIEDVEDPEGHHGDGPKLGSFPIG
ncbi:hypothetical protein V492_02961 [Pseudogymnoascus sp. VKM F-4246]|nr:hypothetical protein V492_02961 [Pseudogymnoascus sp. VKM F-4246]